MPSVKRKPGYDFPMHGCSRTRHGHYASDTLRLRSRYALAAGEGGPNLLLGQVRVGAKLLDGNQGAAGLAELHPDALQQALAGLVTVAGDGRCFLGVDANLGHNGYYRGIVG